MQAAPGGTFPAREVQHHDPPPPRRDPSGNHIFVILIGVPMAILWAILNGIMVFILVWLYQPVLRVTVMWIYAFTPLVTVPIQAIFTPLVDVSARIFRQIRIKASLEGSYAEKLAGRNQVHSV